LFRGDAVDVVDRRWERMREDESDNLYMFHNFRFLTPLFFVQIIISVVMMP